jgi:hypothetical protein
MKTNEERNMKFEIYSSNYINNPQNCLYPNKFIVKDETSAKEAFSHDYVRNIQIIIGALILFKVLAL